MVYPVPCTDELTVACGIIPDIIEIYDISGRWLTSESNPVKINRINTSRLEPGIYLVKISGPGGNQQVFRAVKAAQ